MNNFDFYLENLNRAQNSDGALQQQADIYAESWEASQKRVKAAIEEVYTDLIDDDFFIGLNDALAGFIGLLDNLLKSMGGAKGLLTGVSSILLNMFAGPAAKGLEDMIYNFKSFVGIAQQEAVGMKRVMLNELQNQSVIDNSPVFQAEALGLQKQAELEQLLLDKREQMNEIELNLAQNIMLQNQAYADQLIKVSKLLENRQQSKEKYAQKIDEDVVEMGPGLTEQQVTTRLKRGDKKLQLGENIRNRTQKAQTAFTEGSIDQNQYIQKINKEIEVATNNGLETVANNLRLMLKPGKGNTIKSAAQSNLAVDNRRLQSGAKEDTEKYLKEQFTDKNGNQFVQDKNLTNYIKNSQESIQLDNKRKQGLDNLNQSTEKAIITLESLSQKQVRYSNAIVQTSQAAMSFSFAILSITSLGSTWADDSIGAGEKLLQTFMSLGMAVPMLMNGVKGLAGVMETWVTLAKTAQLTSAGLKLLQESELVLTDKQLLKSIEKMALSTEEITNEKKLALAEQLGLITKEQKLTVEEKENTLAAVDLVLQKTQITGNVKQAISELTLAGALEVVIKKLKEKGQAFLKNLKALLPYIAAIAAVAAAIALLVAGVKLSIAAYNSDAKAAEEAAAAAERAAEAFSEAQQKYEDLKTSMTNYEDAITGLKKLTEGTVEFKEQLIKANEEAMNLINSNNLIYGKDYSYDKNGLITFNEGVLEQTQQDTIDEMEYAQAEKIFATQRAKSLQTKADMVKYNREELGEGKDGWEAAGKIAGGIGSGAALGAGAGAVVGSVIPVIGTAIGAGVGAIVGAVAGLGAGIYTALETWGHSTDEEEKAMNLLASKYSEIGDGVLTEEQIKATLTGQVDEGVINNLVDAAKENSNALKTQLSAISANTAALQASIEANASKANKDNAAYNELSKDDQALANKIIAKRGASDEIADTNSDAYKEAAQQAEQAFKDRHNGKGWFSGKDQPTYDEYMEIVYGEDWRDNYRVVNQKGTNATIQKRKEDGTDEWENVTEKNGLSNQEVEDRLIQHYIVQYNDEQDAKTLENITNIGTAIQDATHGISDDTIYSIKESLAEGSAIDFSLMTPEQIADLKQQFVETNGELSLAAQDIFGEYSDNVKAALDNYSEEAHKAAIEAKVDSQLSEAATNYELDEATLKKQAKLLQQNVDGLKDNAEAAAEMAIANERLNKGVDKLTDGWDDWKKTLKGSDKTTQDYAEACVEVEDAMREMLSLSDDAIIPEGFLESDENLGLLDEIANGSEEAVQKLAFNLTKAQIESEKFSSDIASNMARAFEFDEDTDYAATFEGMKTAAINTLTDIQNMANGIDIGAGLANPEKQAALAASLNEYALAAGWTAEQMQSALSSVGVRAKITEIEGEPTKKLIPKTHIKRQRIKNDILTGEQEWTEESWIDGYKEVSEPTTVAQIDMEDPNNPKGQTQPIFQKTSMGNITPSVTSGGGSGGSGGGGGSAKNNKPTKVKPTEKKKKNDEVERYHEINEVLEDYQNQLDEIGELKDEAFGADKLALMDKEKKKLEELINSHKKYQSQIAKNLNDDKWEAAQVGAQFDENGRITNYEALQEQWMNEWNAQAAAFDAREQDIENRLAAAKNAEDEATQEALEDEKDALSDERDAADEAYENKRKALEQYEETLNLDEEAKQQLEDYLRQIRQLNYEKLEYKLEIRVELNENDLSDIEHQLSRLSENDYTKSAERIALISSEAQTYKLMADDQKRFIEELKAQYAAGDINQEQFIEGLKNAKDAILEAETQIREGIVAVGDELRNAFSDAADELDKVYEKIDRRLNFADFYKDISKIINGETNYDILNSMINSQTALLNTRIDGRTNERDALIRKQQELYTAIDNASSEEEKEQLRETLNEVESRIADLNSDIQSDIQTLAEYAQEEFENSIENIAKEWQEQNFGESLSAVLEDIDLLNRAQEELLTKTNQVYETNKLIRQAEKDIADTTNKRAKQAYEEYINKVKQKQEQEELTQLELDLLTAEYEITKAQIALEEAKDAKDSVRLTRDSEGNFGYVYTANQDKISDAQQALDDATNNYYNIALDGAKESSEQIYQLQEEWLEKVKEINLDATLDEEQKQAKIAEITEYYETMMTQQREKYYIAKSAVEDSSYAHELDYNLKSIADAEEWFDTKDDLISNMADAEETYQERIENVAEKVEDAYGDEEDALEYVDKATEVYGDDLDELIPKMETDLTKAIGAATLAWAEYADKLREVIELSNQVIGDTQETLLKENYKDNYQARIDELLAAGYSEDSKEIQMLKKFRAEKIQATDWFGMAQEAIQKGMSLNDVSWIAEIRDEKTGGNDSYDLIKDYYEKFNHDYFDELQVLISQGYALDSSEVQALIALRDWKLGELGQSATTLKELKEWMTENGIAFASGGYTGDWGPEGRMAILHEKELVLNADDTKNILTSVGIIREISKALDNSALWSVLGMSNLSASYIAAGGSDTLQQEVTIHADFPNVQDHNEIEMAIDNLINAASQYAYRN